MKKVYVTGCLSELDRSFLERHGARTAVIPQAKKHEAARMMIEDAAAAAPERGDLFRDHVLYRSSRQDEASLANAQSAFFHHARALVKVQDGCNNFCTFCTIPFARGFPVSRAAEDVVDQLRRLEEGGIDEAVFTGINMGVYRHRGRNFADLVRLCLEKTSSVHLRISSVEPQSLGLDFVELLSHPRVVPHIHLPLQAGTDAVLQAMNRLYSTGEFLDLMAAMKARRPELAVSTDVITGFPGETEALARDAEVFCRRAGFMKIHVFPFSARRLAKASAYADQVPVGELRRRSKSLQAISDDLYADWVREGAPRRQHLVVETDADADGAVEGTTDAYIKGKIRLSAPVARGRRVAVRLTRGSAADDVEFTAD